MGEMIYYTVGYSIRPMLNPELTASWEKGLTQVAEGQITPEEYMTKLTEFIKKNTNKVKQEVRNPKLTQCYRYAAQFYKAGSYGGIETQKSKKENG